MAKSISLYIGNSVPDAWESVLLPWFQKVVPQSWKSSLPCAVVVPTRAQINYLKKKLIDERLSHLGVYFLTPAGLRNMLARGDASLPAEPEHLRLLLAIAGAEMENWPDELQALTAKSVARSPSALLRALDRLAMAGWKVDQLGLSSFAPLIERFKRLCQSCGFLLTGEADRQRLQHTRTAAKKFTDVLVTGFDGSHWRHWFLLRAAADLSENVTVLLEEPREPLLDIDLCWIGSWEELYGEAQRVTSDKSLPGDSLFSESEMRGGARTEKRFNFLVGINIAEQAEAIVWQCARYLSQDKLARIGVIFPAAGALVRLVSEFLAALNIPHHNGPGHAVPGIFECATWKAWLELQNSPRLNSFLHFLNELPDSGILSSEISRQKFEDTLRESYAEVLLDDLNVLRTFCAAQKDARFRAVAKTLSAFPFLSSHGTLGEFLEQTRTALDYLEWRHQAFEIASITRDWPHLLDVKFSRALFLRWLGEVAATFASARSAVAGHPYASVQLLTVAQAQEQDWSHLIFAGCNEGAWPPPAGLEFARAEEIHAFNQSVQQLNRRASRQGKQGEGHTSVRENHSLYLGPNEERAVASRQLNALLESAAPNVTLAASLLQQDAPERFWNPSEALTQLYHKVQHEPLTQTALKHLQRATARFVNESSVAQRRRGVPAGDLQQTLTAFNARRHSSNPAGEYDFALGSNSAQPVTPRFSVTDIQQMVSTPATVWMKRYLGVEAPEDTANPWASSTGKWVHRWLATISESKEGKFFSQLPSSAQIDEHIRRSAAELSASAQRLCESSGRALPDWWTSGWLNAQFLARHLGNKIAQAEGWKWMVAELPIGRDGPVTLAEGIELTLRGQIDLALAQNDAASFAGQKIWIVDYKTSSARELKKNDLHDLLVKGSALQLGLYTLTVRALGAADIAASVISMMVKNVAPQLSVADLDLHLDIFADLAAMQRSGMFGMKGEIRPAFRYGVPYPLATLAIDTDVLEEKWALTHPALVLEKEEWETW